MWHAGELFFIGYQMDKKPACVLVRWAGQGKGALQFDVRVDLPVSSSPGHAASLHHELMCQPIDCSAHPCQVMIGSCPEVKLTCSLHDMCQCWGAMTHDDSLAPTETPKVSPLGGMMHDSAKTEQAGSLPVSQNFCCNPP